MFRTVLAALTTTLLLAAPGHAALGPTTLLSASLASATSGGNDIPLGLDSPYEREAVTPDGRYVAFVDVSTNLTATADANMTYDVFRRDLQTGATQLVSVNSGGTAAAGGDSEAPSISDDGRYVVFQSDATDLVAGFDNNNGSGNDVYVRDMQANATSLVSRSTTTAHSGGNGASLGATISGNGRVVLWAGRSSNTETNDIVSGGALSGFQIFARDLQAGTTSFVTVDPSGTALANHTPNSFYAITPDGRYVAFQSEGTNLVSGLSDPDSAADIVYRRDLQTATTVLASPSSAGPTVIANSSNGFAPLAISDDGRYIAFEGEGTNLVAGYTDPSGGPGTNHIYFRDVTAGTTALLDGPSATQAGNDNSYRVHMSSDGRYVMFNSAASDLVAGDTNGHRDLFRWDRTTGNRVPVDVGPTGTTPPTGGVTGVDFNGGVLSADGTRAAFASDDTDLPAGHTGSGSQVYLRDLAAGTTQLISSTSGSATTNANATSTNVWMSAQATRITWTSAATDLIGSFGDLNGGAADFYARGTGIAPPATGGTGPGTGGGDTSGGGGSGSDGSGGGSGPGGGSPGGAGGQASGGSPGGAGGQASGGAPVAPGGGVVAKGITRRGSAKRDRLIGTAFADKLYGLGGNDKIVGRGGPDLLSGGPGSDTIDAADGVRDTVDCGPGHDRARVDKKDKLIGCEKVTIRKLR
jgi:Tol biopolymer transport system component